MTKSSGLADSPFFTMPIKPYENSAPSPVPEAENTTPPSVEPVVHAVEPVKANKPKEKKEKQNQRDTMTPRNHDTTVSRYHETTTPRIHGVAVEIVRKAVKEYGKEAATHRFTVAEKREIADLIYTYKNQGIKTSENEVTRIAVNFVIEDYKENGENSVLHKILEALNE